MYSTLLYDKSTRQSTTELALNLLQKNKLPFCCVIVSCDYVAQPIPSPSRSNPWGSDGRTPKFLSGVSPQFKYHDR
jgi:hypothetical protein